MVYSELMQVAVTRSHKQNERDHAALAAGTATGDRLPRFFSKNGLVGTDPKKVKKNGAGKGGWGIQGEEIQDSNFALSTNLARRRSNSSSYASGLRDFKTKFEDIETEPVFEESIHGALEEPASPTSTDEGGMEKVDSLSSEGSFDGEKH